MGTGCSDKDDGGLTRLFAVLDRMQTKVDSLIIKEVDHAGDIRSIKEDLVEAKEKAKEVKINLETRMEPMEKFFRSWNAFNVFIKIAFGIIISLGALLTAMAIIRDKLPW
jgi:hypothetical protein